MAGMSRNSLVFEFFRVAFGCISINIIFSAVAFAILGTMVRYQQHPTTLHRDGFQNTQGERWVWQGGCTQEHAEEAVAWMTWMPLFLFDMFNTPQPNVHGTVAPFPPGSNFVRKYRKCCFHVSRAEFKLSLWKGIELVAVLGPCSCTPCMSNHTAGGSFPYQGMAHRARTLERRGPLAAMNQKCKLHQVERRGWINDDKGDKWMVVALHSHCGWVYVFMQVLLNWCERVNVKTRK